MVNGENTGPAEQSPLGKRSAYVDQYDSSLLFPILRESKRREIRVPDIVPFYGVDIWNAFEVSWLNAKGKPVVAMATFSIPCDSPCLIESKSFKLYLNTFNNTRFNTVDEVRGTMVSDVSHAAGIEITVDITVSSDFMGDSIVRFPAESIDGLDIECDTYLVDPAFLSVGDNRVEENLSSDLLKSNCLVTGQPDWGSVWISYEGKVINREGLLKYIVSFRNHNEFHEQCVERIYMDIMKQCNPEVLTVYARYTRRGGLDINPIRSSKPVKDVMNGRLFRQ